MNSYCFIILRHVNSEKTNKYWNHNVKLLRTYYPDKEIIIIDDNSNYEYVSSELNYKNVRVIQSEFPKRGELLPYYYYLKYKFAENAVIIHDSLFLHKYLNFNKFKNINVLPLWHFNYDRENEINTIRLLNCLKNNMYLINKLKSDKNMFTLLNSSNEYNFYGCFGCMSYINHNFLNFINEKYQIINLINLVKSRADRCCLERILGCIFYIENPKIIKKKSLLGNILTYNNNYINYKWGYTYDEYINNFNKGKIPKLITKIWTGR